MYNLGGLAICIVSWCVRRFLQDDLGHDDVSFTNGNPVNMDVTGNITAAAKEGIILKRHYIHWHCK